MRALISIVTISLVAIMLSGCNYSLKKGYSASSTSSIEESKRLGVFAKEYKPTTFHLNDSIQLNIKEAYAEQLFFRENDSIRKAAGYEVIIKADVNLFYYKIIDTSFYWYLDKFYADTHDSNRKTTDIKILSSFNILSDQIHLKLM